MIFPTINPDVRAALGHLHGRRVSLSAPMPALRPASLIIVDLEPGDWTDITLPAHIAAAELAKGHQQ